MIKNLKNVFVKVILFLISFSLSVVTLQNSTYSNQILNLNIFHRNEKSQ